MEWFFDGLGTEIISLLIGALIGGSIVYKIGMKKQKAGKNSKQIQAENNNNIVVGRDIVARGNIRVGNNYGNRK